MTAGDYVFIIGLCLGLMGLMAGIIGWFFSRLLTRLTLRLDNHGQRISENKEAIGKNKGRIDQVALQQKADHDRLHETTEIRIGQMADSVKQLSETTETLANKFDKFMEGVFQYLTGQSGQN